MLWQVTFKLISNISFCSPSLLPFKGTVSRDSFYPAFPMTFTHLAPLFICKSIFASGFDFAEIFAGTKMSAGVLTAHSFLWLCGIKQIYFRTSGCCKKYFSDFAVSMTLRRKHFNLLKRLSSQNQNHIRKVLACLSGPQICHWNEEN